MFRRHVPTPTPTPESLVDSHLAAKIPLEELRALGQLGTTVRITRGDRVMREAGIGRECMVVLDGTFDVQRSDQRIAELGAGDFMGEIALLSQRPRNATITALEHGSVCVFNPREFRALLRDCPTIAAHVRATADARSLVA